MKKAAWALYDEKKSDRLIEDVTLLVNNLVELFPATERQQQLCLKVKQIEMESDIDALEDIVGDVDQLLQISVCTSGDCKSREPHSSLKI